MTVTSNQTTRHLLAKPRRQTGLSVSKGVRLSLGSNQAQSLYSILLLAITAFSVAPAITHPASTSTTTNTVNLTTLIDYCSEGWTGIPFLGKVEINFTSSSAPLDVYILTQWEGRGQQNFESSICFSNHPTPTSQNCGLSNTPPQCVYARAQVFSGDYNLDLPTSLGTYYYIVFIQCCSSSWTGSTVTLSMRGASGPTPIGQFTASSFNVSSYLPTSFHTVLGPISSINMNTYISTTPRTDVTIPVLNGILGSNSNYSQYSGSPILRNPTQNALSNITGYISPGLSVFSVLEIIIVGLLMKDRKRKKAPKPVTAPEKCADCGRLLTLPPKTQAPIENIEFLKTYQTLPWDFCKICERAVCFYCLDHRHNDKCELRRFQ